MPSTTTPADAPPIVQKTYEAVQWLVPKVSRFPRAHRFTLGDRIAERSLQLLETVAGAAYSQLERPLLLDRATQQLTGLRYLLRLSHHLSLLGADSYGHSSGLLEEIGRMLGGWQKFESGRRSGGK